jgi:hypothetical protein
MVLMTDEIFDLAADHKLDAHPVSDRIIKVRHAVCVSSIRMVISVAVLLAEPER